MFYLDYNNVYQQVNSAEGLCCSACLKPCSIVDFYKHIKKDHKTPPTAIAWEDFSMPVLIPVNHKDFPLEPTEPLNDYTPYPELEEGKNKPKPNPCAVAARQNSIDALNRNPIETPITTQKYDCLVCDSSYERQSNLDRHLRVTHKMKLTMEEPILQSQQQQQQQHSSAVNGTSVISTPQIASPGSRYKMDLPDENDPNSFCHICDRKYTPTGFRIHIRRVHNVRLEYDKLRTFRNPDIIPDLNDTSLYCGACEKQLLNGKNYVTHLRYVHNMKISAADSKRIEAMKETKHVSRHYRRPVDLDTIPDPKDQSFYCGSCDRRYTRGLEFHFKKIHGFFFDRTPGYKCVLCATYLETRDEYVLHLEQIHKKKLANRTTKDDFTCRFCATEYVRKRDISNHLVTIHGLQPTYEYPNNNIQPIISEQFECRHCDEVFRKALFLGEHLTLEHGVVFRYDQVNYHCNLCGFRGHSEVRYREHLVLSHKISSFPPGRMCSKPIDTNFDDQVDIIDSAFSKERRIKKRRARSEDHDFKPSRVLALQCRSSEEASREKKNRERKASSQDHDYKPSNTLALQCRETQSSEMDKAQAPETSNPNLQVASSINDPPMKSCKICNFVYTSEVHYRLHCYKYHQS